MFDQKPRLLYIEDKRKPKIYYICFLSSWKDPRWKDRLLNDASDLTMLFQLEFD